MVTDVSMLESNKIQGSECTTAPNIVSSADIAAREGTASIQVTAKSETDDLPSEPLQSSRGLQRLEEKCEDEVEQRNGDLEALSNIPSGGPVHSVFSKKQKHFIVLMTATAAFFSPLSANIYFPALNTLARDMHVSSSMINLTLTTYMIFQGLAPTVFGDLADAAGRRPAYSLHPCKSAC
jgi:hypothetical protein